MTLTQGPGTGIEAGEIEKTAGEIEKTAGEIKKTAGEVPGEKLV